MFSEESEDEGAVTEVDPSSTNPRLPVEGSSPASLEDTESIKSGVSSASSEADDLVDDEPNTLLPISGSLTSQARGLGLVSLDEVILEDVFSVRARLMANSSEISPWNMSCSWTGCWPDGNRTTPCCKPVRGSYSSSSPPSTYIWEDDVGDVHQIVQGEGGQQGDPLMPSLFCIGQHPALAAVPKELREGEKLIAYQDDLYIICQPDGRSPCSVAETSVELHRHFPSLGQDESLEQERCGASRSFLNCSVRRKLQHRGHRGEAILRYRRLSRGSRC